MKNILLLFASILIAEIILQVACQVYPSINSIIFVYDSKGIEQSTIKDSLLGLKGNPKYFDHDARGYRNEESLKSAGIVAIGDSHTYGTNVTMQEAWPFLIQKKSKMKTYNMGFGGYGPGHYLLQLNDAIELSPQLVIIGVYFGNDFYDNYKLATKNRKIAALLRTDELDTLRILEEESNIIEDSRKFSPYHLTKNRKKKNKIITNEKSSIRVFVSHNSALYGLARALKDTVYERIFEQQPILLSKDFEIAKASLTSEQLAVCSVFDDQDGWRTIFSSLYRGFANDRKDPRIDIGFNLTGRVLVQIKSRVVNSGAKLLVVLLPTKESVFGSKLRNPDSHIGYSDLAQSENSNREELKQFMAEKEMSYIDLQPYLQRSEKQPYPSNLDGHPNALGHKIISDTIVEWISNN